MTPAEQQEILQSLLGLAEAGEFYSGEALGRPCETYSDPTRFEQERQRIMMRRPFAAAHSSELERPGSFRSVEILGTPVLLVRDDGGELKAFRNACRHRGMRLVGEESGCAKRFTCPYHAWTYDQSGAFVTGPHFEKGFAALDPTDLSLHALPCSERWGFVWVNLGPKAKASPLASLEPLDKDLEWLAPQGLAIVGDTQLEIAANWKLLVEGGLEAYHFRIAHRATIGPYFEDNLSSYSVWGENLRSVLPRKSIRSLCPEEPNRWVLRDHANIIYTLMPTCQFLVQQDHIVWINANPLAADRTELRLATLAPKGEKSGQHWERNHQITLDTLGEDFAIAESIQAGIAGGLEQTLHFGRYESALEVFNGLVEATLEAD